MIVLSIIYAAALVWVAALAQHINNLASHGSGYVMSDRSKSIDDAGFTGRSARALRNNMESALMYVPVAAAAVLLHQASPVVTWVPIIYMVARTTFTLGYWLKINLVRSLSWLVGMICIAVLALNIVSAAVAAG